MHSSPFFFIVVGLFMYIDDDYVNFHYINAQAGSSLNFKKKGFLYVSS